MSKALCRPLRTIKEMRGRDDVEGEGGEREKGGHSCWAILCICVARDRFGANMTDTMFSEEEERESDVFEEESTFASEEVITSLIMGNRYVRVFPERKRVRRNRILRTSVN